MHFYDIVFTISIIGLAQIRSQLREMDSDENNTDNNEKSFTTDNYSFLAIIDIVFTEGSKRTCTGTIIHDNVVITAAHCFSKNDKEPELTASFVVIGTKKMFDTGYEQYLPIERVVIHPNYRGWTADLALVFTFSGMASDKPGRIIRLATEKASSADSDVTVFSWGRTKGDEVTVTVPHETAITSSDEEEITREIKDYPETKNMKGTSSIEINSDIETEGITQTMITRKRTKHRNIRTSESRNLLRERNVLRSTTKLMRSSKEYNQFQQFRYTKKSYYNSSHGKEDRIAWDTFKENSMKPDRESVKNKRGERRIASKRMSYYRNNWRRKMGTQRNKLTAEIFGFVNIQTCSKLVEKTMPSMYEIRNPNEVFCYANEMFYITEEDSGAPAMRRGRLIAVTVGGIDYDGERVAVGMKMICFCSWIAENLPKTGTQLQCCKKCCESKKDDEYALKKYKKHKHSYSDE